jgi:hypothetical protein
MFPVLNLLVELGLRDFFPACGSFENFDFASFSSGRKNFPLFDIVFENSSTLIGYLSTKFTDGWISGVRH